MSNGDFLARPLEADPRAPRSGHAHKRLHLVRGVADESRKRPPDACVDPALETDLKTAIAISAVSPAASSPTPRRRNARASAADSHASFFQLALLQLRIRGDVFEIVRHTLEDGHRSIQ